MSRGLIVVMVCWSLCRTSSLPNTWKTLTTAGPVYREEYMLVCDYTRQVILAQQYYIYQDTLSIRPLCPKVLQDISLIRTLFCPKSVLADSTCIAWCPWTTADITCWPITAALQSCMVTLCDTFRVADTHLRSEVKLLSAKSRDWLSLPFTASSTSATDN